MGGRVTRLKGSRLLLFNVCTSGVVYAAGDQIQQRFEGRGRKTADWRRSGRMASVGAPIGLLSHYWYLLLDRTIPAITARAVARKVLADQLLFGPVCLATFFVGRYGNRTYRLPPWRLFLMTPGMGILEGKGSKEIGADMKALFPTAYLVNIITCEKFEV